MKNEEELKKEIEVLELFSGTKSFSKVAEQYGLRCFTIDIDKKSNPNLVKDILKLTKEDIKFEPKIIWASPPCIEYSHAKRRGIRKIDESNKVVLKTLEIIKWFPNAIWFLENPQTGLLKQQEFMKGLSFFDVSYCKYGLPYRKQTRIWTNFKFWKSKDICLKDCEFMKDGKHIMSVGNGRSQYTLKGLSVKEKYKVPQELCSEILQSVLSFKAGQQKAHDDVLKIIDDVFESFPQYKNDMGWTEKIKRELSEELKERIKTLEEKKNER